MLEQRELAEQRMTSMDERIGKVGTEISKEVALVIRKNTKEMQRQLLSLLGGKPLEMDEVKSLMAQKADRTDLASVAEAKSNKVDTEVSLKGIRVLHKQIEHLIVLVIESLRSSIPQAKETTNGV